MDTELIVFIFSLAGTFISMVWKLAQFKEQTYHYIDQKIRNLENNQNVVNHQFELDIRDNKYQADKDILLVNGKIEKTAHKSMRLENAIKDLNSYLEKTGDFTAKRGLRLEDD